jgi:hypothetical protein
MAYLKLNDSTMQFIVEKREKRLEKITKGVSNLTPLLGQLKINHQNELVEAYDRIIAGTDTEYDFFLHKVYKLEWDAVTKNGDAVDTNKQIKEQDLEQTGTFTTLLELAQTTYETEINEIRFSHVEYLKAEGTVDEALWK